MTGRWLDLVCRRADRVVACFDNAQYFSGGLDSSLQKVINRTSRRIKEPEAGFAKSFSQHRKKADGVSGSAVGIGQGSVAGRAN